MPDLHTGPYAAYIWPAYALTAIGLVWMVAETLVRARRWKAKAQRQPGEDGPP